MLNSSFNKQFFNILLLISLVGFLILPKIILAEDFENITQEDIEKHLQLPSSAVENLIHSLINLFTSEWINQMASAYSTPEEMAVSNIMRGAVRIQALNHLLIDAPLNIVFGIVQNGIKIAKLFLAQDLSTLLEELERQSVQKAIDYGMKVLLENEIRITPGAINFKYETQKGGIRETIFQYIMIYKPIDSKRGDLVIRFYSTEYLEPPKNKSSYGGSLGYYTELTHNLPPFIVDIQGEVENYQWKGTPSMKIEFPESVPDLGIRPLSFWEKYVLKPIESQIKEVQIIITKIVGEPTKIVEGILNLPQIAKNVWNQIISTLSQLNPFGAQVGQVVLPPIAENTGTQPPQITESVQNTGEGTEDIPPQISEKEELKKKELQELIDDLLEQIDLVQAEIVRLTKEKEAQKIAEKIEEKLAKEEKNEQEEEEEILNESLDKKEKEETACSIKSININTASKEELQKITGVGPIIVQKIIEARPFYSLSDLIRVSGIGEITLQKIINQGCAYVDSTYVSSGGGGGGGGGDETSVTYPKVLISEIQISPIENRFIELYNPNDENLDLTSWYIQRKTQTGTSWNSLVSSTYFEGKVINSHSHFLIASSTEANIFLNLTLTENNSLVLKNPNREIVDLVGWGQAQDFETATTTNPEIGKSIGRKWSTTTEGYIDTDNNKNDFEIQIPTPKAQNQSPEPAPEPEITFAQNVVVTEVLFVGNQEFVEIYNPFSETINLQNWYLSYFPSNHDWNNPSLNKSFSEAPTTTISAKSHYLIAFGDYTTSTIPLPDWKPYKTHLSDTTGAIGIFSCNPNYSTTTNPITPEQAKNCKIDAFAWGEAKVNENQSFATSTFPTNKSLTRRIGINPEGYLSYIDTDNNKNDFEIQEPTPKTWNYHQYSDLDGDGIIDFYDPETIFSGQKTLEADEYRFKNLVLQNGKLLLNSSTTLAEFKGVKILAENLVIDASSSISADGKGWPADQGPGRGTGSSGGSYGGIGYGNATSSIHGSIEEPTDLGSGGGSQASYLGGAGGGAIIIEVGNTLILDGTISANGENGQDRIPWVAPATGAGSGGSVYLKTKSLKGSGKISVNGGNADTAGAGGGGRIAVYYSTNEFQGEIEALGGKAETETNNGGAGTIYFKDKNKEKGDLIVDNKNRFGISELLESSYTFENLKILNSAHLSFNWAEISISNLEIKNNSILEFFSTTTNSTINVEQLIINATSSLIGQNLVFIKINGQEISLNQNSKLLGNFDISANEIFIDETSSISADGKGWPADQGPGKCFYFSGEAVDCIGAGAGYGGNGGNLGNYLGGKGYGNLFEPTDLGSGGGSQASYLGGAGGGAIMIEVGNTLILAGTISANGENGKNRIPWVAPATGAGSGGSVYLKTNLFQGSGKISVNGGNVDTAGAGGGGRIAVYYSNNEFQGEIQASGQSSVSNNNGGAGTIYFKKLDEAKGDLIIDNNGISLGTTELLEPSYSFGELKILNSGHLCFDQTELNIENVEIKNGAILEFLSTTTISTLNILGQLTINATSSLISPAQIFLKINVNEIFLAQNSKLFGNFEILSNEIFIDTSSSISADGKGYPADQGPGRGTGSSGGSYGGIGYGNATSSIYGSIEEPTDLGSGGGSQASYLGGAGGGAIVIEVGNTLTLDGTISANGENGKSRIPWVAPATGAGSGGSIYLKTNLFQGSGKIEANGGNADTAGAGGGGRIAVYSQTPQFTGEIQALGGTDTYGNRAGDGTVYLNP